MPNFSTDTSLRKFLRTWNMHSWRFAWVMALPTHFFLTCLCLSHSLFITNLFPSEVVGQLCLNVDWFGRCPEIRCLKVSIDSLPENTHIWTDIDLENNHFELHPAVMSTIFMGMIFKWLLTRRFYKVRKWTFVIYWTILRLFEIIVLLSNGNWSAPAYGGNYLKTKRNEKWSISC
jgi:hypothetical protein